MDSSMEDAAVVTPAPTPISTPSTTAARSPTTATIPPALPLDWTRIQRNVKRPRLGSGDKDNNNNDTDPFCCDDATCSRREHGPGSFRGGDNSEGIAPLLKTKKESVQTTPATTTVSGQVVFCLPDTDPSWFQGYFFLNGRSSSSSKPWGLLVEQTDLDECLQCADGGYRQVKLQVSTFNNGGHKNAGSAKQEQYSFDTIEWTGGDMMRLESETCRMIPSQLWTDDAAVSHIETFFGSFLRQLRMDPDVSDTAAVLDLMPDVAVIVGSMELVVPAADVRHWDDDDGLF
jgi:hypothetical protein